MNQTAMKAAPIARARKRPSPAPRKTYGMFSHEVMMKSECTDLDTHFTDETLVQGLTINRAGLGGWSSGVVENGDIAAFLFGCRGTIVLFIMVTDKSSRVLACRFGGVNELFDQT